ncbi:hypothetical protein BGX34_004683 [Mortierella sp. NVP85]|nr:hypothetical protein BGX34_004683 [Mortierella sp. NVP85]
MALSLVQESTVSLYDRWHSGERKMQDLLHVREAVQNSSTIFRPYLTAQHQEFVPGLNYFFIGTLDQQGRPWVSILTGNKGFLHSPHSRTLEIKTRLETGNSGYDAQRKDLGHSIPDPVFSNLLSGETFKDGKRMWGGVGLDFTNRRRNKMNGVLYPGDLLVADEATGELHVRLTVEQTIGNCPKYITIREMVPRSQQDQVSVDIAPTPAQHGTGEEQTPSQLSEAAKAIIRQADCFFISSRFIDEDLADQTSGMDCNHRGGNPGFVRFEGNQLLLPDYSGNRFFNTLGNIVNDDRVGLLFLNFDSGDLLHLTGRARIFVGQAQALYPHTQRCVQVTVDAHFVRFDALPFRMKTRELSPYNPTVPSGQRQIIESDKRVSATLSNVTQHTKDISTFHFTTSRPIRYTPGQYAVLDLSQFNSMGYRHMAPDNPQSLNDDYIRTWTISSAPPRQNKGSGKSSSSSLSHEASGLEEWQETSEFTMTIKRKPGGAISNRLHDLALAHQYPFTVPLVSTGGSFVLPSLSGTTQEQHLTKVALISGGIGSTPFISMIRGAKQLHKGSLDIQWVTSAPYFNDALPDILQEVTTPLESQGQEQDEKALNLSVNVFLTRESSTAVTSAQLSVLRNTNVHFRRLDSQGLLGAIPDLHDRQVLLCGPDTFMEAVKGYLQELRVPGGQILVEDFNF